MRLTMRGYGSTKSNGDQANIEKFFFRKKGRKERNEKRTGAETKGSSASVLAIKATGTLQPRSVHSFCCSR